MGLITDELLGVAPNGRSGEDVAPISDSLYKGNGHEPLIDRPPGLLGGIQGERELVTDRPCVAGIILGGIRSTEPRHFNHSASDGYPVASVCADLVNIAATVENPTRIDGGDGVAYIDKTAIRCANRTLPILIDEGGRRIGRK